MKLLNEEKAMELFMSGDILGLEEIEKQLKEMKINENEDVTQLLNVLFKMNFIIIETEQEDYAKEFNIKANKLYFDMKNKLFEMLEIDLDYYWHKF